LLHHCCRAALASAAAAAAAALGFAEPAVPGSDADAVLVAALIVAVAAEAVGGS